MGNIKKVLKFHAAIVDLATNDALYYDDLHIASREIVEVTARKVNVERASIWLFSDDHRNLLNIDLFELNRNRHSISAALHADDYPHYFEALRLGRAIDANNAQVDPRTSELGNIYLQPLGITSLLDAAVRVSGKVVGVVCLEHVGKPRKWISEEISFSGEVADLVAQVIINNKRKEAEILLLIKDRALEATSIGVLITDPKQADNPIIYCNPAFEKITGYASDETVGNNFLFLQGNDCDQEGISKLREAVREERECTALVRSYKKNGTRFWNELTISPIKDENGRLLNFVGIQHDVTQPIEMNKELQSYRKNLPGLVAQRTNELQKSNQKLEQEIEGLKHTVIKLKESERKYRDLCENANQLIQSVAPNGSFLFVNRCWRDTLGYDEDEISKLNVFDIIHPDSKQHYMAMFKKVMAGKTVSTNTEISFVNKKGKKIIVEGSSNANIKNGKPTATRDIFRNVTEQRRIHTR